MDFDRYCAEIETQTALLTSRLNHADLTAAVPSCPGWNVGQLVRHLGGGQRWAAEMVRNRAAVRFDDTHFRDLSAYRYEDPAVVAPWLTESAAQLSAALRAAGPESPVDTTPVPNGTAAFYARRFTHETAIHRADAMLALGVPYLLDQAVAVDAMDEWFEFHPGIGELRDLLGPGRTVHLHATDTPPELAAEWVVDLTGEMPAWRRAHEKSAVALRGPLADLLLIVYRRRPARTPDTAIFGDEQLLDLWLERVSFG